MAIKKKTVRSASQRPSDAELTKILLRRAVAPETSYATAPALLFAANALLLDLLRQHPQVEWRVIAELQKQIKEVQRRVAAMVRSAGSA